MEFRLLTLFLLRVKNADAWEHELTPGTIDDRIEAVRRIFRQAAEGRGGRFWPDPLERYRGTCLATFTSPTRAIEAARSVIRSFAGGTSDLPAGAVHVGCALNTGEVMVRGNHLIGAPVDVVSRLEYKCGAGQILFTESVLLSVAEAERLGYRALLDKLAGADGPEMRIFALDEEAGIDGKP